MRGHVCVCKLVHMNLSAHVCANGSEGASRFSKLACRLPFGVCLLLLVRGFWRIQYSGDRVNRVPDGSPTLDQVRQLPIITTTYPSNINAEKRLMSVDQPEQTSAA